MISTVRWSVVVLASVSVLAAADNRSPRPRTLARDAYETLLEHKFEGEFVDAAAKKIDAAMRLNPNEAFVWTAMSRLVNVLAYRAGDSFKATSYEAGALEKSAEFAEKAVTLDPQLRQAHEEFARILIALRRFPEAQRELSAAHKIDPEDFTPWLLQSVSWWKQGNASKSEKALEGAASRAKTTPQRLRVNMQRLEIAESRQNVQEVERIHKDNLRLDPNDAWLHGNYAGFLEAQERYEDALREWQRAKDLAAYGRAVEGLRRVKEILDQQRRGRSNE